jgi:hypothetical protein
MQVGIKKGRPRTDGTVPASIMSVSLNPAALESR